MRLVVILLSMILVPACMRPGIDKEQKPLWLLQAALDLYVEKVGALPLAENNGDLYRVLLAKGVVSSALMKFERNGTMVDAWGNPIHYSANPPPEWRNKMNSYPQNVCSDGPNGVFEGLSGDDVWW